MTETEQLRKEVNELRERLAVLEAKNRTTAPAPIGLGILGEAARARQQQEVGRQFDRFKQQNTPLRDDRPMCGVAGLGDARVAGVYTR